MKRIIAALLVLLTVAFSGACLSEELSIKDMSREELLSLRDDIDAELRSRITELPAGEYLVGTDISQGEYVLFGSNALSSYLIEADGFADIYSVLGTFEIISVYDGQQLTITEARAVPYALCQLPTLSQSGTLPAGMYEAGKHFPAGRVALRLTGALGAYTVYSSPRGTGARALSFMMFTDETVELEVLEGEFLLFSGCEMYTKGE